MASSESEMLEQGAREALSQKASGKHKEYGYKWNQTLNYSSNTAHVGQHSPPSLAFVLLFDHICIQSNGSDFARVGTCIVINPLDILQQSIPNLDQVKLLVSLSL